MCDGRRQLGGGVAISSPRPPELIVTLGDASLVSLVFSRHVALVHSHDPLQPSGGGVAQVLLRFDSPLP